MATQTQILQTKNKLKKCQPYFIERDLLPKLYFKEERIEELKDCYGDEKDIEYWIFYYTFIRRLTAKSIGIRLNYTPQNVFNRLNNIIESNLYLITDFLETQQPTR